jgi:hypothetical protein
MKVRLMRLTVSYSVDPYTTGEAAGSTMRWISTCHRKVVVTKVEVEVGTGEMLLLLPLYQKQEGMLRITQPSPLIQRRFLILRQ